MDPIYDWFGIDMANQKISYNWPHMRLIEGTNPPRYERWNVGYGIVTNISYAGIIDDGYSEIPYNNLPYRNDL